MAETLIRPEWRIPEGPIGDGEVIISDWGRVPYGEHDSASWGLIATIERPDSESVYLMISHEWIKSIADYFAERPEVKQLFLEHIKDTLARPEVAAHLKSTKRRMTSPEIDDFRVPNTIDSYKVSIRGQKWK